MKSPKSNGKSKRSRHPVSKAQLSKSQKLEPPEWKDTSEEPKAKVEAKVKSGSWKRKPPRRGSPCDKSPPMARDAEQASCSSRFRPGTSYSDVLFSGENPSTLVKIRGLMPHHVGGPVQPTKSHAKSKKRTSQCATDLQDDVFNQPSCSGSCPIGQDTKSTEEKTPTPPKSASDLTECTEHLMKRLNIEIPSWNFTDFGTFNDIPKFVCQFDDYHYLACENAALVGLRLASDGKFKS